nr:immunoglobulin light chain junction region [Macaca mulatta]
CQQAYNTPYTF